MPLLLALYLSVLACAVSASEDQNSCNNPRLNQNWADALANYPDDPVVLRMFNLRTGLCAMLKNGQIEARSAPDLWEQALTTALLDSARQEREKQGLLSLFGTF